MHPWVVGLRVGVVTAGEGSGELLQVDRRFGLHDAYAVRFECLGKLHRGPSPRSVASLILAVTVAALAVIE